MARGDQLARQWKIIQILISSRNGKSAAELAEILDCGWRTVYRDLEALQNAGFPLYSEKINGKSIWLLLDSAKHSIPIPFDLTELMALYFSRRIMNVLKNTFLKDSLESLFEKIKATLPPEYVNYLGRIEKSLDVKSRPYKHHEKLQNIIEIVSEAAVRRKYIEIAYYSMSRKKESRRRVAPYKIWFFDDTFYLIGDCGLREDIRIFALDRISEIHQTDETFEMPDDFNVDDFMRTSFGVFHGESVKVRIWFAPEISGYIREKVWHATQLIESQKDGSLIFEAEVAGTKEIKYWVLKWGANAVVMEPKSLRDEIRAEAAAMLRMIDGGVRQ